MINSYRLWSQPSKKLIPIGKTTKYPKAIPARKSEEARAIIV